MKLTNKEVEHVASLARLRFSPEDIETFAGQLSAILDYVDKLAEVDLEGVEPMAHVHAVVNAFREDEVREGLTNEAALDNAPAPEDGCFRVAKVIEEG